MMSFKFKFNYRKKIKLMHNKIAIKLTISTILYYRQRRHILYIKVEVKSQGKGKFMSSFCIAESSRLRICI